jgi:hypothetical protein
MPDLPEPSFTIDEFCAIERICRTKYNALREKGLAPDELRLPGRTIRITAAARAAWHKKMLAWGKSPAAKREAKQRTAHAQTIGRLAVQSPKHNSKKRRRAKAA